MCLPEAEKLLQLSEIFGVSVDYILKGKTIVEPEPVYVYVKDPDSENASRYNERIVRKYVGIVLALVFGIISVVVLLMGGTILTILPFTVMLIGILLACNVKHPWLIMSWTTYIMTIILLPFFTALNPFLIFNPIIYSANYLGHFILVWSIWIILLILILCTIKIKRGYVLKKKQ